MNHQSTKRIAKADRNIENSAHGKNEISPYGDETKTNEKEEQKLNVQVEPEHRGAK